MSKLTDEHIAEIFSVRRGAVIESHLLGCARAIESAATEPLLQRIAELERQLEEARKDAKPCPTCESLARAVMLDQTGKA